MNRELPEKVIEQPRSAAQKDKWLERRFEIDGVKYLIAFRLCVHGLNGYNDYRVYSSMNAPITSRFTGSIRCGTGIFRGNTTKDLLDWYSDLLYNPSTSDLSYKPLIEKPKKRVKNRVIVI